MFLQLLKATAEAWNLLGLKVKQPKLEQLELQLYVRIVDNKFGFDY